MKQPGLVKVFGTVCEGRTVKVIQAGCESIKEAESIANRNEYILPERRDTWPGQQK